MVTPEVRVAGLLKQEALAYIESQNHSVLYLGRYNSDWVDAEEQEVKENTNRLVDWLGGEGYKPVTMQAYVDGVEVEADEENADLTPGERIFTLAVGAAINHEDPEVMEGVYATLRFGVSGLRVVLLGEGSSWTDQYFTHRETGAVVLEDALEQDEREDLYDNPNYDSDSDMRFSLHFEAIIEKL